MVLRLGAFITNTIYDFDPMKELKQIRIAFDGDAVLFSDEAERIFQKDGLEAFVENEKQNARKELPEGPFAKFLKTISDLQKRFEPEALRFVPHLLQHAMLQHMSVLYVLCVHGMYVLMKPSF